jgi:hypothetical protein
VDSEEFYLIVYINMILKNKNKSINIHNIKYRKKWKYLFTD